LTDSIPISLSTIQETKQALDAALSKIQDASVCSAVLKARKNLEDEIANSPSESLDTCDRVGEKAKARRQRGYNMIRKLDEMKRDVKQEFEIDG
jgi:hypothetical protein